MNYLLASDNAITKFPYSLEELRSDNPQTSFAWEMSAEELSEWGVYSVEEQNPPAYNEQTESIELQGPSLVNGAWVRVWLVVAASAEEIESRKELKGNVVRAQRDKALIWSDHTQLVDFQGSAALQITYKEYRQQLRDLPQQTGFPFNYVWPSTDFLDSVES